MLRFNSDAGAFEGYDAAAWRGIVAGPASATDGAVALFDQTTGKLLKDGPVPGAASGLATLDVNGKLNGSQLFPQILSNTTASGRYTSIVGTNQNKTMTENTLQHSPIWFSTSCTVDRISIRVETAGGAGSVIRLGIYAALNNMLPGNLILDAGTVDATTTGNKEITISQALAAGVYYLSAVAQGSATTPVVAGRSGNIFPSFNESANMNQNSQGGITQSGISGALPASPTNSFGSANSIKPAVSVRIA
jgi:hypothetical protein